jgi:predicted RNA-binding Zn ribbon-like protein
MVRISNRMADWDNLEKKAELVFAPRVDMCLDFANTLVYRGSAPTETLHTFGDLVKWGEEARVIPPLFAQQLHGWTGRHPRRVTEIFARAIALRELIYRIFRARASGANVDDADLEDLNRELRDSPSRMSIRSASEGFGWELEESKPSVNLILAAVLWSAGDLLAGPQLSKLRECSNEKCLWLFLDDSKNGTRRWCSMSACGNRAKAHRHYLRQKNV